MNSANRGQIKRKNGEGVHLAVSLLLALIFSLSGCAKGPGPFTFSVVGDTPYRLAHALGLREDVTSLDERSRFLVHLGDIKSDEELCTEQRYSIVSNILRQTSIPVFMIPGDNEFNDCADPAEAWVLWEKYFLRFERHWLKHGKQQIDMHRQQNREENFAFLLDKVLFVGVNILGGRVHDKADWDQRDSDNAGWLEHWLQKSSTKVSSAVIFSHAFPQEKKHPVVLKALIAQARAFDKPVLYLHGDGHSYIDDIPVSATNVRRIQVRGLTSPPVYVTVTHDPQRPFIINKGKLEPEKK